ncbi:MAG TPA: ABC transporter ATP-binding protein [Candidatus Dormibacteraeota bacterium]|nr:ABC transporter ATP-binding protein [Candidatus Dormibacteraeota bacterium]
MNTTSTTAQPGAAEYDVELVEVTKRYGTVTALSSVSLEIEPGEFLVLLGPSGCGKSTILKVIAGLEDATEGDIYIRGKLANYIRPKARDVAMVFQNYALYPHMTVETNLGFPLRMRGASKAEQADEVARVAGLLGITDQLKKYPEQLSGGQRQRVALGRAIIRKPTAFLMDEPLSNLDALLRVEMRSELLKLHRRVGRTTVYVTHDQVEAMTMASRIVVMRMGVIQQVGTPVEVYGEPANTFVATFVGSPPMNLFEGRFAIANGMPVFSGKISVPLDGRWSGLPMPDDATLGVRPEDILIAGPEDPTALPGRIDLVEKVGAEEYLSVGLDDGTACIVRASIRVAAHEGERIRLRFPPDAIHLFTKEGLRVKTA